MCINADVKPGSRKDGSEDGIELAIENGRRNTTLRKIRIGDRVSSGKSGSEDQPWRCD